MKKCSMQKKIESLRKQTEANSDFKVGDFVDYDASGDGKDLMTDWTFAEVMAVNDDGTLKLQPYNQEDFDEIDDANPQFCKKMKHFAGMTDARNYYMDGKYNVYTGYYEIIVTDKELGRPYSFAGTIDDLSEVEELLGYYDETMVYDQDIKDDVMHKVFGYSLGYDETDEEGINFADFSDKTESKKRSEKRTVQPPSYDVYTYDELSDEAKEKVKSWFLDIRREDDGDVFQDSCMNTLYEVFPNSDVKIEYSLSYSQGDGFNTYGTLSVDDLLNVDLSKYPFKDSNITPLSDKDAIKAVCEKADVTSIDLPENRRYGYSMADRIEVVPDYDVELTDEETALLSELEKFAQDVMGFLNSQSEDWGYDYFYEATDEEVADWANANDYEFTADGEIN